MRKRGDYDREMTRDEERHVQHLLKRAHGRDSVRMIRRKGWIFRILGMKQYAFGRLPAFMAENRRTGRRVYGGTPAEIYYQILRQSED